MSAPTVRAQRTLENRRRMVRAAYDLFCVHGYTGTTLREVARSAGVAEPTIYYTFGGKAALLEEVLGAAVVGFDHWRAPPVEDVTIDDLLPVHTWWPAFEAATSAADALEVFVANGVRVLQRVGPLVSALHGATADAAGSVVVATAEQRRVDAYRAVMQNIATRPGGLRRGLTTAAATDIVVVLFSAELYQGLSSGRGWSRARCERFFREVLGAQLLPLRDVVERRVLDSG